MIHSKGGYALLTRREKDWIVGKISVSKTIERDIRYRIRKKIEILHNEELPLLMNRGFFGHDNDNVSHRPDGYVFPFDT
jgi:hypothetical protein